MKSCSVGVSAYNPKIYREVASVASRFGVRLRKPLSRKHGGEGSTQEGDSRKCHPQLQSDLLVSQDGAVLVQREGLLKREQSV